MIEGYDVANMDYVTLRKKLIAQASKQNIPLVGEFELTGQCNLNCYMCYVHDNQVQKGLSTDEWKQIFQEAVASGMLYATLTGGEVLVRSDFLELYEYLYDLGVRIAVFTNGTLINQEIVDVFLRRPPELIAITLYGKDNVTYELVSGHKKGFDLVNQAIDLLILHKLPLLIRTIPIPKLYHQIDDLIAYAKSKNLNLAYALYISPKRDEHVEILTPVKERLTPEELIDFEKRFIDAFGYQSNDDFRNSKNGFECVAGKSAYFINYRGEMQICVLLAVLRMNVVKHGFEKAWEILGNKIREIPRCGDCKGCDYISDCTQCMARRYLEGGFSKCSPYLKEFARRKKETTNG